MCDFTSKRANQEHWAEYIRFLRENPCMVKEQTRNEELWCTLSKRLNRVNDCKKTVEKWKESIKNWRRSAIRKYENGATLSCYEHTFIMLSAIEEINKCDAKAEKVVLGEQIPKDTIVNKPYSAQERLKKHRVVVVTDQGENQNTDTCTKSTSPGVTENSKRANQEHWAEYIRFLRENPCMVKEQTRNEELWCTWSKRLNRVNDCKKTVEKWKESIKNWRRNAIRKYENGATLSCYEHTFIMLSAIEEISKCDAKAEKVVLAEQIPKDAIVNQPYSAQERLKKHRVVVVTDQGENQNTATCTKSTSPAVTENVNPIVGIQSRFGTAFGRTQRQLLQPLKVYYQNVRGLRTKLDKFSNAVSQNDYDGIVLTETWLIPRIASHRAFDDRYLVYRTDRSELTSDKSIGGGVLIAVLKTHGTVRRHLTGGAVEEVWITLVNYNLVVGAVYLPPRTPEIKIKAFLNSANILRSHNKSIILGDFNMRRITWIKDNMKNVCLPSDVTVETFKTLLEGFKLLSVKQRNYIVNSTGVILDLVYTNTDTVSVVTTDSPFVSPDYHHPPLKILLPLEDSEPTGG